MAQAPPYSGPEDDVLLEGQQTYGSVGAAIDKVVLVTKSHNKWFYIALGISACFAGLMLMVISYLIYKGVGIWGNEIPSGGPGTLSTSSGGSVSAMPEP